MAKITPPATATGSSEVADGSVTNAKLANMANATVKGRNTSGTGVPEDVSMAQLKTLLALVAANVSDFDTQVATTAVLKSLFDANTILAADSDNTPAAVTVAASRIVARLASGNIKAATLAEIVALGGTPDGTKFLKDDGTLAVPAGSSAGTMIALTTYGTSTTYTSSTTSDADVDATNLAVTFTVPASGKVRIDCSAHGDTGAGGGNWTLRESTTTVQENSLGANSAGRLHANFYITGLTPGASKTYKWGFHRVGGSGSVNIYTGGAAGTLGNALIEVYAAP